MAPADGHPAGLRIGELARRTATSARSLRYYEQRGLIDAHRDHNGYRRFDQDVIQVVLNIRHLLDAGLSIDDIHRFGSCVRAPDLGATPCEPALEVYENRLRALDSKIATLHHLRVNLAGQADRLRTELRIRDGVAREPEHEAGRHRSTLRGAR